MILALTEKVGTMTSALTSHGGTSFKFYSASPCALPLLLAFQSIHNMGRPIISIWIAILPHQNFVTARLNIAGMVYLSYVKGSANVGINTWTNTNIHNNGRKGVPLCMELLIKL